MKFSIATYTVFLASVVNVLSTELEDREVSDSPINLIGHPDLKGSFKCGLKEYSGDDIFKAAQFGVNLHLAGETRGKGSYPHRFPYPTSGGFVFNFPPECPDGDDRRQEYPLKKGRVYNAGPKTKNQGDERVIYYWDESSRSSDGKPNVYFCGLMTHEGANGQGNFVQCKT